MIWKSLLYLNNIKMLYSLKEKLPSEEKRIWDEMGQMTITAVLLPVI